MQPSPKKEIELCPRGGKPARPVRDERDVAGTQLLSTGAMQ